MKLTESERHEEWAYRYQERLAMLCGDSEPSERQQQIAKIEADQALEYL